MKQVFYYLRFVDEGTEAQTSSACQGGARGLLTVHGSLHPCTMVAGAAIGQEKGNAGPPAS